MRSILMSGFVAICVLLSTSFIAPKSHAVVGLIVKKKVVKVIGGIGMGGGGVLGGVGLYIAGSSTATGWAAVGTAVAAATYMALGIVVGGIGLIILDDKQTVADIEFARLTKANAPGVSEYSISTYNSEIEELNAIRKTIQAEIGPEDSMEKAKALWIEYSGYLSTETRTLAEAQALNFMKQM